MAYSTITDLTKWIKEDDLIQLCTDTATDTIESASVTGVVNEMIASADAEIDGYLLGRWSGLRAYDPVPDEINRLSAQIAVFNLFLRNMEVPEDWRTRYEDCIRKLELASKGSLTLGLDTDGVQATEAEAQYRTDALDDDDDLDDDDPRNYTQDKLGKL